MWLRPGNHQQLTPQAWLFSTSSSGTGCNDPVLFRVRYHRRDSHTPRCVPQSHSPSPPASRSTQPPLPLSLAPIQGANTSDSWAQHGFLSLLLTEAGHLLISATRGCPEDDSSQPFPLPHQVGHLIPESPWALPDLPVTGGTLLV